MPSILVLGGGTWGSSTALALARRGYDSVTVLDKYAVPSPISAGNDINKILDLNRNSGQTQVERHVSAVLYDAVMRGWTQDAVFKGYFHETGMIIAASSPEGIRHVQTEEGTDDGSWIDLQSAFGPLCLPVCFRVISLAGEAGGNRATMVRAGCMLARLYNQLRRRRFQWESIS